MGFNDRMDKLIKNRENKSKSLSWNERMDELKNPPPAQPATQGMGDFRQAEAKLKPFTPPITSNDQQKEYADNWMREYLPSPVANLIIGGANKLDQARETPAGKFADRAGEQALGTAVFDPSVVKTSTGNKYADIGANAVGNIMGLVLPTGGANTALSVGRKAGETALSKFAPTVTNKLAKVATAGAGAGASLGAVGSLAEGKNLKDTAKETVKNAALFALLDAGALQGPLKSALIGAGAFGGQSALAGDNKEDILINALTGAGMGALGGMGHSGKIKENISKGKFEKAPTETPKDVKRPNFNFAGDYKLKYDPLTKALDNYNKAIEEIHNYFGTNELRTEEIPLIKNELGIDLDGLVADIQKAEQANLQSTLQSNAERNRMSRVAGVSDMPDIKKVVSGRYAKEVGNDYTIMSSPTEAQKLQPNTNILPNEIQANTEPISTPKPTVGEKIDTAITYFDQVEANAWKRIEERNKRSKSSLNSNPIFDPSNLGDYAIIGASKIGKGSLHFAKWSDDMLKDPRIAEIKDQIKPHLEEIYNHAKNIYNNHTTNNIPDTSKVIATKTKGDKINIPEKANRAYIGLVDDLHRASQFDKYAESVTGEKTTSDNSVYQKGLNSRGSDIISKQILTDRLVDPKGNVIGEGFSSITKQIPKGLETKFEDYLINRHAPSWMEQGRKVFPDEMGMTPELSMEKARQYEAEYPEFKQIADQYHNFMTNIVQKWGVDTGLISQEAFDNMRNMYPDYVPLQREFKTIEKTSFNGAKKSFANQSTPIKKATGSERPIISPIESTIEMIDTLVKTAKRNDVMQTLIKQLDKDPQGLEGFAKIVKDKEDILGDINSTLREDGIEGVIEKYNQQFDEIYSRNKNLNRGNVVTGLVDGKKVHVEVNDPQMLDALTSLSDRSRHIVIDFVGGATRIMKNLTTGINPVFSLARNIFRDIPTSYINSKTTSNPIRFANDLVGSFVSILSEGIGDSKTVNKALPNFASSWLKNQGELFKSYKEIGGGHSSSISSGRNALKESKNAILQPDNNPLKLIPRVASKGLGVLERFNNAIESAPRLAEYKRLAKAGDKQQGLFEANDVTVNFKRRGKIGKDIDAFIPYFNAAIQGLDKLVRVYKDNPAKAVAKSVLAVTIPTIYLYSVNHDNPDYQKLNNYTKDNNFLIPNGDGTFTKIPKPREVGVVFGSLVERSLRQWQDNDPEAFREFVETVKANFTPPIRTIAHPILRDLPSNKDFVDRPIVPRALEDLSPRYQYDEKTSEVSKKIGDIFNVSPKKIDYLGKSYLGVLAQLGIPATAEGSTIGGTLKQQVTVDPLYSNDILNRFYDNKEKLDTEYNDFKSTGETGGKSKEQFGRDMSLRSQINKINNHFSDIRKSIKKVEADNNLTEAQKKEKVKQFMLQMQEMADKINKSTK